MSFATLAVYVVFLPGVSVEWNLLVAVAIAGLLGGITGAFLMHRINRKYVRYTMIGILSIAFLEIFAKIYLSNVNMLLYFGSVISVMAVLAFLVVLGIFKKTKNRVNA